MKKARFALGVLTLSGAEVVVLKTKSNWGD